MRNTLSFIIFFYLIVINSLLWAAPATNLQITYDKEKQTLHIDANHPSDRLEKYFIQRVELIKNSGETEIFPFHRQTRPDKFIVDLNYSLEDLDHLDVKLFSSEGGLVQGSVDIPKSKEKSDEKKTVPNRK